MPRPLISITDCSTGETVVREMNDEELAQHNAMVEKNKLEELSTSNVEG